MCYQVSSSPPPPDTLTHTPTQTRHRCSWLRGCGPVIGGGGEGAFVASPRGERRGRSRLLECTAPPPPPIRPLPEPRVPVCRLPAVTAVRDRRRPALASRDRSARPTATDRASDGFVHDAKLPGVHDRPPGDVIMPQQVTSHVTAAAAAGGYPVPRTGGYILTYPILDVCHLHTAHATRY